MRADNLLSGAMSADPKSTNPAQPRADAVLNLVDHALERHSAALSRLKAFILPGGTRSAALAHGSRTIA